MRYYEVSAYNTITKKEEYLFNVCEIHKDTDFFSDFDNDTFKNYRGFITFHGPKTKHECKYCQEKLRNDT